MSRRPVIIAGSITGATLVLLLALFGYATTRDDVVVPGVDVEGIDVGGMSGDEARVALAPVVAARSERSLSYTFQDEQFAVDGVAIGIEVDVDALVEQAMTVGRTGALVGDRVRSLFGVDASIDVEVGLDEDALRDRVEEIAAAVDRETFQGDVEVDPITLSVSTLPPTAGRRTLVDEAVASMAAAVVAPGDVSLELPVEVTEPDTDDDDVEAVAALARAAVTDDLTLLSDDGELVLGPRDVAALISAERVGADGDARLELAVTPAAVEGVVVPVADVLLRDPVEPSFDAPAVPAVTFDEKLDAVWRPLPATITSIPGVNGTALDVEITADQLTTALRSNVRTVVLRLVEIPPEHPTSGAAIDTMLSTFTTYHPCCATRVHNIQRLADLVDRTVVWPGEQFSVNQISGVRECSKGFLAAGMILNGEIVDSCGGGVSQFGTTTVNAVFFAGLQPDAYKPHSFYISRYPMGREATLNYPSPDIDVQFTNDTGSPIFIRTSHTATSVTVTFYGSSDVTEVRADVGSPTNHKPYKTIRRVNRSLPAGSQVQVQGGQDGFSVRLERTVVRTSGRETTDDWSNTYIAENSIVEYNPAAAPPPPAPDPEPEPEPSPSPQGNG